MKYLLCIFILALSIFAKEEGKALYHSCKFCHGYNAETKYMGEIPVLKNLTAEEIEIKLRLYKKGELDVYGYGSMMKMQMKNIPTEKIPALASYIEKL
ncbi:MAG: c-type cytochrome [Campylobacteraceae bacterium]|nr:c-type cytochrome [Campylobacteraceae bacterium]